MKTALLILALCAAFYAGRHTAQKPDEYILAAYEEGRQNILVDIIDGEIIEIAQK
jgi:hypothetical protein